MKINSIGKISKKENLFLIQLEEKYIDGLKNLSGYSHIQVIWWGHLCNNQQSRSKLVHENLFKKGPKEIGVFATRSPSRPNPIMVSTIKINSIDFQNGIIYTPFIDAEPDTPVLDIKPYQPMERIQNCTVPKWCNHWPKWQEDAIDFNWHEEINFN